MHASRDVIEIDNTVMRRAPCSALLACPDDGLSTFLSARPRLFGIAYRRLGSVAENEDIVQDVWIRWQTTDRRAVKKLIEPVIEKLCLERNLPGPSAANLQICYEYNPDCSKYMLYCISTAVSPMGGTRR